MKFTFHLNRKNVCSVATGVCVVILAFIPLAVPPAHLGWLRWTIAVILCSLSAVVALIYQALVQSREDDAERERKELERDKALAELQRSLAPRGAASSATPSNAITRAIPHSPGTFDSVAFFRTAYLSPLQDVGANSYIAEAERVRPDDKASFYLDVLAVGSIQMLYDDLWWNLYRSQLRALATLNAAAGMLPIQDFRKPFDQAAIEFSEIYAQSGITFEKWIKFMENSTLLKVHPSQMVEITLKGRDLLKYLLHHGRDIEGAKRL